MLNSIKQISKFSQIYITFLFFISIVIIHSPVSAAPKEEISRKYRELGYEQQQKGNLDEALNYYIKAISLGHTDPIVLNDMGIIYEQIGFIGKSEEFYLEAIKADPKYLPAYNNLAYLYLSQGMENRAASYFKRRYELSHHNDPWAQKAKNELLRIKPEYKSWFLQMDAQRLNQAVVEKSRKDFYSDMVRAQQFLQKGLELKEKGELEKALVEVNRALSLTPDNPKVIKARQEVIIALTNKKIKEQSELAIKKIRAGDTYTAKREIEKILSTLPNESIFNSQ